MSNPLLFNGKHFPSQETRILLPGVVGQLEAYIVALESVTNIVGIVCHPHPLYGGNCNNKVVTTIARTWRDMGLAVIRFNFRGVGASQGEYAEGAGETEDLIAIIDLVKQAYPTSLIWLAGFSFGAYVALRAVQQRLVAQLVTVAPPIGRFACDSIKQVACPWLVIQGDQDELIEAKQVYAWLEQLAQPPQLIRLPQAGHFFHSQLGELRLALEQGLTINAALR